MESRQKLHFGARCLALILLAFTLLHLPNFSFASGNAEAQEQNASQPETSFLKSLEDQVDQGFVHLNDFVAPVVFYDVTFGAFTDAQGEAVSVPLIVAVIGVGAIVFTLYFGFINLKLFSHAVQIISGKYDDPKDDGEITSFQALSSALSATVGLGNIAGVAVAMFLGGAGAVFWMWVMAFLGMSLKFVECSFAMIYRKIDANGHVLGGPMIYLKEGFHQKFENPLMRFFGTSLSFIFAICVILGSIGGGNLFQSNQSYQLVAQQIPFIGDHPLLFGVVLAALAGSVIIGGIKRIGHLTSKLVPTMCVFYVLTCLFIIISNISEVPAMFAAIFHDAFSMEAGLGGLVGIAIIGIKRAAFSNEAGLGSSAIAHSAAKTKEPVREGLVAMMEPFIDTLVICTMTALAILITNAHIDSGFQDIKITAYAFGQVHPVLPVFLTIAATVFAFSTLISWSYYGERASEFLFGPAGVMPFKIIFLFFAAIAPMVGLNNAIGFSEIMILSLAFANILGLLFLVPQLKPLTNDYIHRLKTGRMEINRSQ